MTKIGKHDKQTNSIRSEHERVQEAFNTINERVADHHKEIMRGIREKKGIHPNVLALIFDMSQLEVTYLNRLLMENSHLSLVIAERQKRLEQIIRKIITNIKKPKNQKDNKKILEIENDLKDLVKFKKKMDRAMRKRTKELKKQKAFKPSYIG